MEHGKTVQGTGNRQTDHLCYISSNLLSSFIEAKSNPQQMPSRIPVSETVFETLPLAVLTISNGSHKDSKCLFIQIFP